MSSNPKKSARKGKKNATEVPPQISIPQSAPPSNIFAGCYTPIPPQQASYGYFPHPQGPYPSPMTYSNQPPSPYNSQNQYTNPQPSTPYQSPPTYQSPPPFTGPQFTRMQPQIDTDSEFDTIIPETQPSTEIPDSSGKAANLSWEQGEERSLARSWVDISEDPIHGNDQKSAGFWKKVATRFLAEMGKGNYRTEHSIATKWRNVNKLVMSFNSIYIHTKNNWPSGENDDGIRAKARELFLVEHNKVFKHDAFWEVVRDSAKWKEVHPSKSYMSGSKRTKTSATNYSTGSGSANFVLNNDEGSSEEERAPHRIGRDKAKGKQQSNLRGTSSDEMRSWESAVSGFQSHLNIYDNLAIEKQKLAYEKQKGKDLRNFLKDHSHLTGSMFEQAVKAKEEIAKKYGW